MLARRPLILLALLLPSFSQAQLNGGYTIDAGGGGDYTSFTAAIADLTTLGITGPVVFSVANGTYTEQLVLGNVPGNSNVNTITFRGASLDSSLVSLTSATGTTAPTVRMSGADRVSFEHITISRTGSTTLPGSCVDWETAVADPSTSSQYIFFRHCRFTNVSTNGNAMLVRGLAENNERNVVFDRCRFEGGFSGVQWSMDYSQLTLEVRNSVFTGQRSRCIQLMNAGTGDPEVYIEDNDITGPLLNTAIAVDVAHNSNLLQICRNRVVANAPGGAGMSIVCNGSDPVWTVVRNNMIIGAATTKGMVITGITNGLGIINNSISTVARALELVAVGSGNLLEGNALLAASYPLYHTGGMTFTQADHNVMHTTGVLWVYWGGASYADIGTLRCATGTHLHSVQADPRFISNASDLHVQADSPCLGQGATSLGLWQDFDGEVRSLPATSDPDIGADEVNGICAGLAGTYIIGSSGAAHHATFNDALNAMKGCGISGPVIFEVEDGTYSERLTIGPIKGTSSVNTVTFRGQSLDSTLVTLSTASLTSTIAGPNHLIRCEGCSRIRFEHMTLSRTGTSTYARVVELDPSCAPITDLRFGHCRLTSGSSLSSNATLIYRNVGPITGPASYILEQCALVGGYYAVEANPLGAGATDTVSVLHCDRLSGANGFRFSNLFGPVTIEGNTLVVSGIRGIDLAFLHGPVRVIGNRISGGTASTSIGALIASMDPAPPARVLLANNAITVYGQAVMLTGINTRLDFMHNSIRNTFPAVPGLRWFVIAPPVDVNLMNNAFSAVDDVALWFNSTGINVSNNCFHRSSAGPVVTWNSTSYTTITALQAGSGTHAASVFADPHFYDPLADLHCYGMELDAAATPLPGIVTDIDGEPRDPTMPDIGCDEFTPGLWNEQFDICVSADPAVSDGSGRPIWIYRDHKVIARILDNGNDLGTIDTEIYINSAAVRQSPTGQYYMDRNWHIEPQNAITGANVDLRLFYHADEFAALVAADPAVTVTTDCGVSQYDGPNDNCMLADNTAAGDYLIHYPTPTGMEPAIGPFTQVGWYDASLANFSEFYITTLGMPLPIDLLSFSAYRIDPSSVKLDWSTASEHGNDGFELWRMIEGEPVFTRVGWVEGAGENPSRADYAFIDANSSSRQSYYRLKQVDVDGGFSWSPLAVVEGGVSSSVIAYPNPARDRVWLRGLDDDVVRIELIDMTGRSVASWPRTNELDALGRLGKGTYTLSIVSAGGYRTFTRLVLD